MSKKIFLAVCLIVVLVIFGFLFWKRPSNDVATNTPAPASETVTPEQTAPPDEFDDKLDAAFVELEMIDGE